MGKSEGSELGRWERCVRVTRWQVGKGRRVVRWQGVKGARVVRWKGERFLVLFKRLGLRVGPRFHLFVSDVNQRNGAGYVQYFLACPQGWKDSSDLTEAVKM